MKILVKKTILHYIHKYPAAQTQLLIWYSEFSKYEFSTFNELKNVCLVVLEWEFSELLPDQSWV